MHVNAGQIVYDIDGKAYRVSSTLKVAGELAFKLADLQGKPWNPPADFFPIDGTRMRFASMLKYVFAYNKDLTEIVNSMIREYKLPTDPKMNWAAWFQTVYGGILASVTPNLDLQDEIMYNTVIKLLVERRDENGKSLLENAQDKILGMYSTLDKLKNQLRNPKLNPDEKKKLEARIRWQERVKSAPLEVQVSDLLKKTFEYYAREHARVDAKNYANAVSVPDIDKSTEDVALEQPSPSEEGGTYNILDTEEHAVGTEGYTDPEAYADIKQFIQQFYEWLLTKNKASALGFAILLDIYWKQAQQSESGEVKLSDLTQEWLRRSGLKFDSLKQYEDRIGDRIRDFISERGGKLGNAYKFVDLMQRKFPPPKTKARPAKASSAKPKCPHCGSSDYGLMPTDFETAKCNGCGKNWEHGIVEGINDPKAAADETVPLNLPKVMDNTNWTKEDYEKDRLEADVSRFSKELKKFPKGPTGMTPDATKATPEWQEAKRNYNQAFQALRNYNSKHTAAENLGQCSCEWSECPLGHQAGGCPNPAAHKLEIYGFKTRYCQPCTDATIEYIRLEQGGGDPDDTVKILSSENKEAAEDEGRPTLQKLHGGDSGFTPTAAGEGKYTAPGLKVVLAEDWFIYVVDETTEHMWVYNTEMWYEWGEIPNAFGEDTSQPMPTVEVMIPYAKGHTPDPLMKDDGQQLTLQEFENENAEWTDPGFDKEGMLGHDFVDADQQAIRPDITPGDTGRVPHGRTQGSMKKAIPTPTYAPKSVIPHGTPEAARQHTYKERPQQEGQAIQCLDCGNIGIPSRNGNCAKCNSEAVTSKVYMDNSPASEARIVEPRAMTQHASGKLSVPPKTWQRRNCSAWGTDEDTANQHSVDRNHGIRMIKEAKLGKKTLPCCGSVTNHHKPDCRVYNQNFTDTLKKLYPDKFKDGDKVVSSMKTAAGKWRVTIRDPKGRERQEQVGGQDYSAVERAVTKKMKDNEQVVSVTVASKTAAPAPAPAPAAPAATPAPAPAAPVDPAAPQTVVAPPPGTPVALPNQQQEDSMRKTVPPELPGKKWHMTSKTASILEDAFQYFMESKKEGGLADVFNETYTRTGKGEDKYMAASKLMMDFEYAFQRQEDGSLSDEDSLREDAENALREIVGDDPNYSESAAPAVKEVLKSGQNTPEVEAEVAQLAQTHPLTEVHENCNPAYEHDQWWIVCGPCGATWAVEDASGGQSYNGLDLEEVDEGDGSCQENLHEGSGSEDDDPPQPESPTKCSTCGNECGSKVCDECRARYFHTQEASTEKQAYEPDANSGIRGSNDGTYIYQADVWCPTCAQEIAADIIAAGQAPEDSSDEASYDSDDFPKGPFFDEESDAPEHCSGCHIFLENPLTEHGYEYMRGMVDDAIANGRGEEPHIKEWMDFYEYHGPEPDEDDDQNPPDLLSAIHPDPNQMDLPLQSSEKKEWWEEAQEESAKDPSEQKYKARKERETQKDKKESSMENKEAATTQPTSGEDAGFYVTVHYTQYGIELTATNPEIANIAANTAHERPDIYDLMEDFLRHGWEMVNPEDIGALTDGEIIANPDGNIYWHERYQIEDMVEELINGNKVRLKYGGNVFEEDEAKGERRNVEGDFPDEHQSSAAERLPDPKKAPQKPKPVEKEATGEMSQSEADDPEAWPMHHAIAKALGGKVKAFDEYQGPYVLVGSEIRGQGVYAPAIPMKGTVRLWIQAVEGGDGAEFQVYNEDNEKLSDPFWWEDTNAAVDAAMSVLDQPEPKAKQPAKRKGSEEKQAAPGDGGLQRDVQNQYENHPVVEMLWDYIKRDPSNKERVQTAWGSKTKQGLVLSVARVMKESPISGETIQ